MSGLPQGAGVIRIAHEQQNALACLHKAIEVYGIPERHGLVESILFLFYPFFASLEVLNARQISAQEALMQTLGLQGVPGQLHVRQAAPTVILLMETCTDILKSCRGHRVL